MPASKLIPIPPVSSDPHYTKDSKKTILKISDWRSGIGLGQPLRFNLTTQLTNELE